MNRCFPNNCFPSSVSARGLQRWGCRCRPCLPCCQPIIPPAPPCPPCPSCPIQEFPNITCTLAFEAFADVVVQTSLTPVTISDVFNANNGPAPYTVLNANFSTIQLPLANLIFTPLGSNNYNLMANVSPMVIVTYLDGNNAERAKFVQAPLQLNANISSSVDPNGLDWWAFMESGTISNVLLSNNSLTFEASAIFSLLAIPKVPEIFPVLQNYSCSQSAPVPSVCRSIHQLLSHCEITAFVSADVSGAIPYTPLGPAPYSNPVASPVISQPYVISFGSFVGLTLVDLAVPITLTFFDGNNQQQSQSTFFYFDLIISDAALLSAPHAILDLHVEDIHIPFGTISTPFLEPDSFDLFGTIEVIDNSQQVLVTNAVQCGSPIFPACDLSFRPPTEEFTG